MTLSGREARERRDGRRQVSKRTMPPVFGVAVEMRGFHDWVIHPNLEATIDAYLDHLPAPAVWRRRVDVTSGGGGGGGGGAGGGGGGGAAPQWNVQSVPLAACYREANNNFAYAKLARGDGLQEATPDFMDTAKWREVGEAVFERVTANGGNRASAAAADSSFSFGAAAGD